MNDEQWFAIAFLWLCCLGRSDLKEWEKIRARCPSLHPATDERCELVWLHKGSHARMKAGRRPTWLVDERGKPIDVFCWNAGSEDDGPAL